MWFDTHAHLAYSPLLENVKSYYDQARSQGVVGIVTVGTNLESSKQCVRLANQFEGIWAAVGIHPNDCVNADEDQWKQICDLVTQPKVVAIGETGLDRHWDDSPFELQQDYFQRHIDLSCQTGLPFIVHMRDCEQDIVGQLRENSETGPLHGVMHSFTGQVETANLCQEWGMHISYAGMLTFKNGESIRQSAKEIQSDRLLVETDCPFLTPHPFRGKKPNHPALVQHTGAALADCRTESVSKIAEETTANACRFFGVNV